MIFLFVDDSYCANSGISSLTALAVPVDKIQAITASFYSALGWAIRPKPGRIVMPPEIRGANFLPGEGLERKEETLASLIALVEQYQLQIFRVGYFLTPAVQAAHEPGQRGIHSTLWFSLLSIIKPVLSRDLVVPVMDGFDSATVKAMSEMVRSMNVLRSLGHEPSVAHSENIVGQVFYADSRFSCLTQLVDVISYLRLVNDLQSLGRKLSPFKQFLLPFAVRSTGLLTREEVIAMVVDGELQGPESHAKPPFGDDGPITRICRITPSDAGMQYPPQDRWM